MSVRVRFAPSPTGRLHVGNVRTALLNFLFAKAQKGIFILRIDDTDQERSTLEYEEGIKQDLSWLSMHWDESFNQSNRFEHYQKAAQDLKDRGLLYPCYETADELDRQRKLQRVQGRPPIYNRAALALTQAQITAYEQEGRKPHWRFRLSGDSVSWDDKVRGQQSIETASLSDPVLIRGDGSFLYTLPSVVDDIDYKITDIIRGEDHVTNSGAQIEIFKALSDHLPAFAHTPLLVGQDGKSLSKRLGSLSMAELKSQHIEPMAICSLLAKIGTSDAVEARNALQDLISEFAFSKIGRAPARFSEDELVLLNSKILHNMPYEVAEPQLQALEIKADADFWQLIRANIDRISEARIWSEIIYQPNQGIIDVEDQDFCASAAQHLPDAISPETWSQWTQSLKENSGRKGKTLFMPLRKALTGQQRGPEMGSLLFLMGAERAKARLKGQRA